MRCFGQRCAQNPVALLLVISSQYDWVSSLMIDGSRAFLPVPRAMRTRTTTFLSSMASPTRDETTTEDSTSSVDGPRDVDESAFDNSEAVDLEVTETAFVTTHRSCHTDKDMDHLLNFLKTPENVDLLFPSDATIQPVHEPYEPSLLSLFHECSSLHQHQCDCVPSNTSDNVRLVQLLNTPMSFLGISLNSTALVGVQLIVDHEWSDHQDGILAELQFTLLTTEFEAQGPSPLVWLFYKIIGGREAAITSGMPFSTEQNEMPEQSRFTTSGFTRVWVEIGPDGEIRLCNKAKLQSRILVPSVLVSMLPMSIGQMKSRGDDTLRKTIRKDLEPAIRRFQTAFDDNCQHNEQLSSES